MSPHGAHGLESLEIRKVTPLHSWKRTPPPYGDWRSASCWVRFWYDLCFQEGTIAHDLPKNETNGCFINGLISHSICASFVCQQCATGVIKPTISTLEVPKRLCFHRVGYDENVQGTPSSKHHQSVDDQGHEIMHIDIKVRMICEKSECASQHLFTHASEQMCECAHKKDQVGCCFFFEGLFVHSNSCSCLLFGIYTYITFHWYERNEKMVCSVYINI